MTKRNYRLPMILVFALSLVLGFAYHAAAEIDNPEAEAKYRHDVMEAIGGHMGSMSVILRNQIHLEDLPDHAEAMLAMARISPFIFPEGSDTPKSDALDEVWDEPEAFDEAMDEFIAAAENMVAAVDTGDSAKIGKAMRSLGGTCKGCHDDFKAE